MRSKNSTRRRQRLARQAEARKIEAEVKKLEQEVRLAELRAKNGDNTQRQSGTDKPIVSGHPGYDSLIGLTKRFGDSLRHFLPTMPTENAELPL